MNKDMQHYPVFLNLSKISCLVAGAGDVGLRKIKTLLSYNPLTIEIVDPAPAGDKLLPLLKNKNLKYLRRAFVADDIKGKGLVFAATNNKDVNAQIADLCSGHAILCNIADAPDKGNFVVPATVRRDNLNIAISTGGASPALARKIRMDLEDCFGDEYGRFLTLMQRLRTAVLDAGQATAENTTLFKALVNSTLLDAVIKKNHTEALNVLKEILPADLQCTIEELLDGIC